MKDPNLKNKIAGKFQYDLPYLSSVPKFVLTTPAQTWQLIFVLEINL